MEDERSSFLDNHLAQTTPYPLGLKISHADGVYIYDEDGKAYLDLIAGIAVNNLGHNHLYIKSAITAQLEKHLHVMVYGEFRQKAQDKLANELCKVLPDSLNTFYFLNSGAEANEAAIKLAKRVTGRQKIIAFKGAYHGSTNGALSIGSNEERKRAFRPLLPGIQFLELNNKEELSKIDQDTAAVFLETVQGDAGVQIPSLEFMKRLRERCLETGSLLVFDEIQCGVGRTGKFWAFEHYDIIPDILTAGKALGAGLPFGCLMTSKENMNTLSHTPQLGHITSFGGHPLVCAAAAAGLEVMQNENILAGVAKREQVFKQHLEHKKIVEIRQIGLMLAVELEDSSAVEKLVKTALEKGIILFFFLSTPNAFRISPPLNIPEKDIIHACKTICEILDS